eukprot:2670653-Pyramimonas_sp.AAC.1
MPYKNAQEELTLQDLRTYPSRQRWRSTLLRTVDTATVRQKVAPARPNTTDARNSDAFMTCAGTCFDRGLARPRCG